VRPQAIVHASFLIQSPSDSMSLGEGSGDCGSVRARAVIRLAAKRG
jgi:hypothetical protein